MQACSSAAVLEMFVGRSSVEKYLKSVDCLSKFSQTAITLIFHHICHFGTGGAVVWVCLINKMTAVLFDFKCA